MLHGSHRLQRLPTLACDHRRLSCSAVGHALDLVHKSHVWKPHVAFEATKNCRTHHSGPSICRVSVWEQPFPTCGNSHFPRFTHCFHAREDARPAHSCIVQHANAASGSPLAGWLQPLAFPSKSRTLPHGVHVDHPSQFYDREQPLPWSLRFDIHVARAAKQP